MLAKKRGRPATGHGRTLGVRCHDEMIAALDAWIAKQREPISRPEAIRRLIEAGLKAKAGK